MSTAYHLESDGQTEVVNRCLETYLRCFISDQPKTWVSWIHWDEYWYNTTFHYSTEKTPFEIVYGRHPPVVFVKLRAHRQQFVVTRINAKLAAKYYGPYPIIEKIGVVAYRLKLPAGSRVHPVFHVSLLKKAVDKYQEEKELPQLLEEPLEVYEPEAVLAARKVKQHGEEVKQVLIHWK
ncbi:Ty-3/Gypsy retroelement related protein, partial [Trifolium medium]|nr:Ty-3/Gypsy retroelement related protein [Trifolium medium]